jgi:hypothetical protein
VIVPSVRLTPAGLFSIIFHVLLLIALSLPFLVIYLLPQNRYWSVSAMTLGALFSFAHAYLIYVSYTSPPQEFGYVGLLFAPVLEAIVVVPLAIPIILVINKLHKN